MRQRVYIYVDGVMRPAWNDMGPGHAKGNIVRGELVVGESAGKTKSEAAREREAGKKAAA